MYTPRSLRDTRTPRAHEVDALVTVEVAERLAAWAATLVYTDPDLAKDVLTCLAAETSQRTATRVRSQALVHHIDCEAQRAVGMQLAIVGSERRLAAQAGQGQS